LYLSGLVSVPLQRIHTLSSLSADGSGTDIGIATCRDATPPSTNTANELAECTGKESFIRGPEYTSFLV